MAHRLRAFGVKYTKAVKALGVGMAGGTRRAVHINRKRYHAFKVRVRGLRWRKKAGFDPVRMLRTGGTASMTYGQVQGVSNTMLDRQRHAVAAAGAPGDGPGRQNMDLALTLMDAPHGKCDPAHQAHAGPIGGWAKAI